MQPNWPRTGRYDAMLIVQSPCETYDRIEIPEIKPDVTRVILQGGVCS